jgi:SAM-dependent methyltransferase
VETANVQGKLWGSAARDWAEIQEPMNVPLWEAMLNAAQVGPGTRLLDVGCGGGGASLLAAAKGAQVTGLDVAESLIACARERDPNSEFRVGNMAALPFANGAFDVVFAANSLQFAGDWLAALRELGRVCVLNGRIAVGLFAPPEKVAFRVIFETIGAMLPEPLPGGGPFALSAPGKLEDLFEQAGLGVLAGDEVDCPFGYPNFATFWRGTTAAGPFQSILPIVDEARLKSALRDAVEPFCGGDGRILIQPNRFKYVVAAVSPFTKKNTAVAKQL